MKCKVCKAEAAVGLKSRNAAFCEKCYLEFFRRQVQRGIESRKLFEKDEKILVALSGGKDSLSLALELSELGYQITGLFIDLGIPEASPQARRHVEEFCSSRRIPLQIIELEREGLAIPSVKAAIRRPVCSACGKIKRHYFNRATLAGSFAALATGHNLDDEAARLMSNTLRWDAAYLSDQGPRLEAGAGFGRKVKPLWRLSEFETANYAFLRGIDCHLSACPYSVGASFSVVKNWLHELDLKMPGRKLDFYQGFLTKGREGFARDAGKKALEPCSQCGSPTSSGELCGVCRIRQAVKEKNAKDLFSLQ